MHELDVHLVFYSKSNIVQYGLCQTVEDISYIPLLICYSLDRAATKIIDLTAGEVMPKEFTRAILDANTIKYAYHAENIWFQISKLMEIPLSYGEWRDLAKFLNDIGFESSRRVLRYIAGKDSRYLNKEEENFFCMPHWKEGKPIRNRPQDFPEKWKGYLEKAKEYIEVLHIIKNEFAEYMRNEIWQMQQCKVSVYMKRLGINMDNLKKAVREENREFFRELTEVIRVAGLRERKDYRELSALADRKLDKKAEQIILEKRAAYFPGGIYEVRKYRASLNPFRVKTMRTLLNTCRNTGYLQGVKYPTRNMEFLLQKIIESPEGKVHYLVTYPELEVVLMAWLCSEKWLLEGNGNMDELFRRAAVKMWGDAGKEDFCRTLYKACLYGGGKNSLACLTGEGEAFGLNRAVMDWRNANADIVNYWGTLNRACLYCVKFHTSVEEKRIQIAYRENVLEVTLPSGRKILFLECRVERGEDGEEVISCIETHSKADLKRGYLSGAKLCRIIVRRMREDYMNCLLERLYMAGLDVIYATKRCLVVDERNEEESLWMIQNAEEILPEWCSGLPIRGKIQQFDPHYEKEGEWDE